MQRRLGGWVGNLILLSLVGGCGIFWTSQAGREEAVDLVDSAGSTSTSDAEPAEDVESESVVADPGPYEIIVDDAVGGIVRIEPALAEYEAGDLVTLTAIPAPTHRFAGWEGELAGNWHEAVVRMNADVMATPIFISGVDVTVQTIGDGEVEANRSLVATRIGETVTFTAIPAEGRVLQAWITNPVSVPGWWSTRWDYRVPVAVTIAAPAALTDAVAAVAIDFGAALESLDDPAPFDPDSIRVVEVDADGAVTFATVPFEYEPSIDDPASGVVRILLDGPSAAGQVREFDVYFDTVFGGHVEVASPEIEALPAASIEDVASAAGAAETFDERLLSDPTLTIVLSGDVSVQAIFEAG